MNNRISFCYTELFTLGSCRHYLHISQSREVRHDVIEDTIQSAI